MVAIVNPYTNIMQPGGVTAPPTQARAVTPSNTVDLAQVCRGLYIGVAGDVSALLIGDSIAGGQVADSPQVYKNLPAGYILVGFFSRVYLTGTTATNIIALQS